MSSILPRLCLALFACSAAVACEEEGPDTTDTTGDASEGTTDETTTGKTTADVTAGSLAMPPDDSDGEDTGASEDSGDDDTGKGPSTTLAPPKLDAP